MPLNKSDRVENVALLRHEQNETMLMFLQNSCGVTLESFL